MISLLLTLFISLFSVGPSINTIDAPKENNIKQSIDYWEDNNGTLFVSSGYTSSYQELACSETWQKLEQTFSTIWPAFTNDYGDFIISQVIPCSGLYVQIPLYFTSDSSYTTSFNYVSSNYDSYRVTSMVIYNRMNSIWSNNSIFNTKNFYAHAIDFYLNTNYILEMLFLKSDAGANQCSYSIEASLYNTSSGVVTAVDTKSYSMFVTNSFTYTDVFFVSDYWLLGQGAEEQYRDGYHAGYNVGVETGKTAGYNTGYGEGYQAGLVDGASTLEYNSTALTIFNGIFDVGLLPVNVFLTIFNFELFGVNIAGILSGLLTLSVVIIIVRFLLGGKKDD